MADDSALPLDLLERGDPSFVDVLRAVRDAGALADFAEAWFVDARPASRRLLLAYLDRPLNAFGHEGLVKRLFKRAEAAGDDALMARFLVLFDRSVRRGVRRSTMPRGRMVEVTRPGASAPSLVPEWASRLGLHRDPAFDATDPGDWPGALERLRPLRLFTVATRSYLRRRAWRYLRNLGRADPARYVAAAAEALALYRDEDGIEGPARLDHWGLVHILYHESLVVEARAAGWATWPGRDLAELVPEPAFGPAWDEAPGAVVGLVARARSRLVRRWAIGRVAADLDAHGPALPLDGWFDLLGHRDPEVVGLAGEVLDSVEGLDSLPIDRWVALAESVDPSALDALAGLVAGHVEAERAGVAEAVRLAVLPSRAMASLGFSWLQDKAIGPGDLRAALGLVNAACDPLRPGFLAWLREVVAASPGFEPAMVLDFLDGQHADARREGWAWFRLDPRVGDDVETWRKLLDSPHDDVRLALVAELEARAGAPSDPSAIGRGLDPEALRQLWATVLLGVRGTSRAKPAAIGQVVRRLEASPGEGPELLPLLGAALRSGRGPERRAALVALVRLAGVGEEGLKALVRSSFSELQID